MLTAEIVDPFRRKTKVKCFSCDLSYSAKHYLILYESEKLAFFKIKFPEDRKRIYCHDCLYKSVLKSMGEIRNMDIKMITMEDELTITFYQK
ncbi:MAG: hypothetical protein CMI54_05800 [Parcubacteria group bacterium]|nr:hypothetical protein [Parcubacteria group bacterium]